MKEFEIAKQNKKKRGGKKRRKEEKRKKTSHQFVWHKILNCCLIYLWTSEADSPVFI